MPARKTTSATTAPATVPVAQSTDGGVLAGVVQPAGTNVTPKPNPKNAVTVADGKFYVGAKLFATKEAAEAALALAIEMGMVKAPSASAKPENVKQEARRQLADLVVKMVGEAYTSLPADSPIIAALGTDTGQIMASWVHHLPVHRDNWPTALPKPNRSNWK